MVDWRTAYEPGSGQCGAHEGHEVEEINRLRAELAMFRDMHEHSAASARDYWQKVELLQCRLDAVLAIHNDDRSENDDWDKGYNDGFDAAMRDVRAAATGAAK